MPLNCNTVQAGGAALLMGGPASCQINQRMSLLNFCLVRREYFSLIVTLQSQILFQLLNDFGIRVWTAVSFSFYFT